MSNWKKARLLCNKKNQEQIRGKVYDKLRNGITHLFFVEDTPKADFVIVIGEDTMKEHSEEIILAQKLNKPIFYTDEKISFTGSQMMEMALNRHMDMDHSYEIGGE